VDATGIGAQIGEELVESSASRASRRWSSTSRTKKRWRQRRSATSKSARGEFPAAAFLRRSINAVKRYTSPTGHFRFDAERTDQGHADEFWAMALANAAAEGASVSTDFVASETQQAHAQLMGYAS
jgi:phage FluMu gp28-like protein